MKKNLLKQLFVAAALLTAGTAAAQDTYVGTSMADTWVRSDKPADKFPNSNTLEVKSYSEGSQYFYGLMSFQFTAPAAGNEVAEATLRLTTRYKKGDSEVKVYYLPVDLDEATANYENMGTAIEEALKGEPVAIFKLKGDRGNAPNDNIAEGYNVVSAWTNTIDLTSCLRALATPKVTLLFVKSYDQNNSSQFFSKEATDLTLKDNTVFKAEDLVPQLTVSYQEATNLRQVKAGSAADLWVNTASVDSSNGSNEIEVRNAADKKFYGLVSFNFEKPAADEEVKSATLRLVTRYKKGDSQVKMYAFEGNVEEGATTYATAEYDITSALETEPLADFRVNSYAQWAPTDGAVNEEYAVLDKWTNVIDVTEYLKTVADRGTAAFLLEKVYEQDNSTQLFSKEANDQYNSTLGFTFAAQDIVPQLVINYLKSDDTPVTIIKANEDSANEGIYTIAGQRVNQMTRGLYIVNGKKVFVK